MISGKPTPGLGGKARRSSWPCEYPTLPTFPPGLQEEESRLFFSDLLGRGVPSGSEREGRVRCVRLLRQRSPLSGVYLPGRLSLQRAKSRSGPTVVGYGGATEEKFRSQLMGGWAFLEILQGWKFEPSRTGPRPGNAKGTQDRTGRTGK